MEKIIKKVIKEVWVAYDGVEFESEDDCRKYEQDERRGAETAFNRLSAITSMYSSSDFDEYYAVSTGLEDSLYVFDIYSEHERTVINKFASLVCGEQEELVPQQYIGKRVCICVWGYDDGANFYGTAEEMIQRYTNAINKIFKEDNNNE